jgi:hypothetical protein
MTKKHFLDQCKELEAAGWTIISYEPQAKKATYEKNGVIKVLGR